MKKRFYFYPSDERVGYGVVAILIFVVSVVACAIYSDKKYIATYVFLFVCLNIFWWVYGIYLNIFKSFMADNCGVAIKHRGKQNYYDWKDINIEVKKYVYGRYNLTYYIFIFSHNGKQKFTDNADALKTEDKIKLRTMIRKGIACCPFGQKIIDLIRKSNFSGEINLSYLKPDEMTKKELIFYNYCVEINQRNFNFKQKNKECFN